MGVLHKFNVPYKALALDSWANHSTVLGSHDPHLTVIGPMAHHKDAVISGDLTRSLAVISLFNNKTVALHP